MKKVSIIAALNHNDVIGKNNAIPWHSSLDMKHFRTTTLNNTVVMGRKTFESLNNTPLSNRMNFVLTRSITYSPVKNEMLEFCSSLRDVLNHPKCTDKIFIIGGAEIYKLALESDLVDECIISKIDDESDGIKFPFQEMIQRQQLVSIDINKKFEMNDLLLTIDRYTRIN